MKENKVQFIAVTAMAVALTYVFTAFVNVRLPIAANGGLIHLGNTIIYHGDLIWEENRSNCWWCWNGII